MTCTEARQLLPAEVYGELRPAEMSALQAHLEKCPECRQARAELGQLTEALDTLPSPEVRVNLAEVYRQAALAETRLRKRWRRVGWLTGAAAAVLLGALFLRVEIRWHAGELVVGWGAPPAPPAPPLPAPPLAPQIVIKEVPVLPPSLVEDMELLKNLAHGLAAEISDLDRRRLEDMKAMRREMVKALAEVDARWLDAEKDVRALYTAQFDSRKKGDSP